MQYIIMKQVDSNTWTSFFGGTEPVYVYTTLLEAQTKLVELQANNLTGTNYKIESFPEGSEI